MLPLVQLIASPNIPALTEVVAEPLVLAKSLCIGCMRGRQNRCNRKYGNSRHKTDNFCLHFSPPFYNFWLIYFFEFHCLLLLSLQQTRINFISYSSSVQHCRN